LVYSNYTLVSSKNITNYQRNAPKWIAREKSFNSLIGTLLFEEKEEESDKDYLASNL